MDNDESLQSNGGMYEETYKIKWEDSLGRGWMNIDNLKLCLFSETYIGDNATDKVEVDLVSPVKEVKN